MCGETLCLLPKESCGTNLPGVRKKKTLDWRFGTTTESLEGMLTFHAREFEGNCAVYLTPQTGEVYAVDQGRTAKIYSFYINELGETFSEEN